MSLTNNTISAFELIQEGELNVYELEELIESGVVSEELLSSLMEAEEKDKHPLSMSVLNKSLNNGVSTPSKIASVFLSHPIAAAYYINKHNSHKLDVKDQLMKHGVSEKVLDSTKVLSPLKNVDVNLHKDNKKQISHKVIQAFTATTTPLGTYLSHKVANDEMKHLHNELKQKGISDKVLSKIDAFDKARNPEKYTLKSKIKNLPQTIKNNPGKTAAVLGGIGAGIYGLKRATQNAAEIVDKHINPNTINPDGGFDYETKIGLLKDFAKHAINPYFN